MRQEPTTGVWGGVKVNIPLIIVVTWKIKQVFMLKLYASSVYVVTVVVGISSTLNYNKNGDLSYGIIRALVLNMWHSYYIVMVNLW